jgi:AraC-like DNA-binding protein
MAYIYRYPKGTKTGHQWLELEKAWRLPNDDFMPHSHEYMEMTLITEGNGWHRVGRQEHLTTPGDIIIIPPGIVHSYFRSRNQVHRNFHFDPELLVGLQKEAPDMPGLTKLFPVLEKTTSRKKRKYNMAYFRLSPKELAIAEQMMSEMDEEQNDGRAGQMAAMRLILKRLFVFISRVYEKRAVPISEKNSAMIKSLDYMNNNLLKPLTLEDLAKTAGLSVSHYRRLFQLTFGDSPIDYMIRLRVRKACILLEKNNTAITEIGFQCGFTDSNYFSRQFKKIMEKSPRQYRELYSRPTNASPSSN